MSNVELMWHTDDPVKKIATAARVCYSTDNPLEIKENLTIKEQERMVKMILKRQHLSILEQINFTFSIKKISRVASHQLVRHRMANYAQRSLRYTKINKENQDCISTPKNIKNHKDWGWIYEKMFKDCLDIYEAMVSDGIPAEDARYILPNGITSSLVVQMNGRSLHNFFKLRTCLRAQNEILVIADDMFKILHEKYPVIFDRKYFGPTCMTDGYCKDNNKECPRYKKYILNNDNKE